MGTVYEAEQLTTSRGLPVITMEIAGSGTLKDKLKKSGPLAVTEAVDAVLDVISGLEAAFARGVLHRDIKPSNCFVCPEGSVKVGDFGLSVSTLARTDTFITAHGKIMGIQPTHRLNSCVVMPWICVQIFTRLGQRFSPCSPTGRPSKETTRCRSSPTPSTKNRNR
jgi:serine/threonine protein kinase